MLTQEDIARIDAGLPPLPPPAPPPPGPWTQAANAGAQAYNDVYAADPLAKSSWQGSQDTGGAQNLGMDLPVKPAVFNPLGYAADAVGGAVGLGGGIIGGLVGAAGTPIKNAIQGRPLWDNFGTNIYDTAVDTAKAGYQMGRGGTLGLPFAVAGAAAPGTSPAAQTFLGGEGVAGGVTNVGAGVEKYAAGDKVGGAEQTALGGLAAIGSGAYMIGGIKGMRAQAKIDAENNALQAKLDKNPMLKQAYNEYQTHPDIHAEAANHIARNPGNAFNDLAYDIKDHGLQLKEAARSAYDAAAEQFDQANPGTTFDVSQTVPEMKPTLNKFGLDIEADRGDLGRYDGTYTVKVAPGSPTGAWTKAEVGAVQDMVDSMAENKTLSPKGVADVHDVFSSMYEASDRPKFHAMISQLGAGTNQAVQEILPPDLKAANNLYTQYHQVYDDFLNKIFDSSGNVKESAPGFLSSLYKNNKGIWQENASNASAAIGFNINGRAKAISNMLMLGKVLGGSGLTQSSPSILPMLGGYALKAAGFGGAAALFAKYLPRN